MQIIPSTSSPTPADRLYAVPGLRIGTAMAAVPKANRRNLVLFELAAGSAMADLFPANRSCAAPVQLCRERPASGSRTRALVINTGNAIAGIGADGLARARSRCDAVASWTGVSADASFNSVTTDGDMSTNDSFILMTMQGAWHAPIISLNSPEGRALTAAVIETE